MSLGKPVGLLGSLVEPEEKQGWSLEADPRQGGALSDLSLTLAGELYDLDATSLQLKVLHYVSPGASSLPPALSPKTHRPVTLASQFRLGHPILSSTILKNPGRLEGGPAPALSLALSVPLQLQQETQATHCCLLLVSEDNLQLSCKVRVQVHCEAGQPVSAFPPINLSALLGPTGHWR